MTPARSSQMFWLTAFCGLALCWNAYGNEASGVYASAVPTIENSNHGDASAPPEFPADLSSDSAAEAAAAEEHTKDAGTAQEVQPLEPSGLLRPQTVPPAMNKEQVQLNPQANCLQPPPIVSWSDYKGPFRKLVGAIGRQVDRTSVQAPPHYRSDRMLCSLMPKDKLALFARSTFEPLTILTAAFDAGLDQAANYDPSFGQSAAGYGRRFAADYATIATAKFFSEFVFPAAFSEDPRYYRMGRGTFTARFGHALQHTLVAYRDDGTRMFNYSLWLGTATGAAASYAYHPGLREGSRPVLEGAAYTIAIGAGFDVLREFWPEIARKFKMPFRYRD